MREWIKRCGGVGVCTYTRTLYVMGHDSAVRAKGALPHTTAWTGLKGAVLSAVSQTEEDLVCGSWKAGLREAESRMLACRAGEPGRRRRREQTSSHKTQKSWGSEVQHGDCG